MRWYVDISPLGARKSEGGSKSAGERHCVEAAQWQEALKLVRERRGDESSLGDFAIELLDEGCRAIDPATRKRYVVHRAPADAAESRGEPIPGSEPQSGEVSPGESVPSAKPSSRDRARPSSRGGRTPDTRSKSKGRVSIPDDPVPRGPAAEGAPGTHSPTLPSVPESDRSPAARRSSVPPAPVPAPMQAETAFERMAGGLSVALPSDVHISHDAPTEVLPPFKVVFRRSEDPTPAAPITYRELAYAVAESTTVRDAESVARAQLEVIQNAISGAPKGKLIQLAVFDHEFKGRPARPPLVTLSFKDWRGTEPVVDYPADRTTTSAVAKSPGATESRSPESLRAPKPTLGADAGAPAPKPLEVTIVEPGPGLAEKARQLSVETSGTTPAVEAPGHSGAAAANVSEEPAPIAQIDAAPVTEPSAVTMAPVMSVGDGPAVVATPEARHASTPPPAPASAPPPAVTPPAVTPPAVASPAVKAERAVPMPTPSELRRGADDMAGDDEATVVQEPPAEASAPPPAPAATTSAPPPAPAGSASAEASAPPPPRTSAPPPPRTSAPPPPVLPSGAPLSKRPPPPPRGALVLAAKGRRKKGDDLLTDLFEACGDLAFLNDALEAAEFAGKLLVESLPCRLCLVSFYDIDKKELVVVRHIVAESTIGDEQPESLLMQRIADSVGGLAAVLRRGKAVLASSADFASDPRLAARGASVRSAVRGPVNHGGRYLGLIELFDPLDGKGFIDSDTHAVHYVAEQLGEFVNQRGVAIDAERVLRPKLAEIARV